MTYDFLKLYIWRVIAAPTVGISFVLALDGSGSPIFSRELSSNPERELKNFTRFV